jgi:aryl-alcohol dehydrogenase-like predicted oxidoreductase
MDVNFLAEIALDPEVRAGGDTGEPVALRHKDDRHAADFIEMARRVVERVAETAQKLGAPRVHIALAWLLQKEPVTAPIIGATKISHLEDAAGALAVKLTPEEVAYLEEPYEPHRIVGHQ